MKFKSSIFHQHLAKLSLHWEQSKYAWKIEHLCFSLGRENSQWGISSRQLSKSERPNRGIMKVFPFRSCLRFFSTFLRVLFLRCATRKGVLPWTHLLVSWSQSFSLFCNSLGKTWTVMIFWHKDRCQMQNQLNLQKQYSLLPTEKKLVRI